MKAHPQAWQYRPEVQANNAPWATVHGGETDEEAACLLPWPGGFRTDRLARVRLSDRDRSAGAAARCVTASHGPAGDGRVRQRPRKRSVAAIHDHRRL